MPDCSDRVLVLCASRSRPEPLARMIESVRNTSSRADIAVWIDDDQMDLYRDWRSVHHDVAVDTGPRCGPCLAMNWLAKRRPGYAAYGAATDDCRYVTPGWDRWVLEQVQGFPAGIGLLGPDSGNGRRMDFPWMTEGWLKAVGSFCYPETFHFYWDVALELMGETLNAIRYAAPHEFGIQHDEMDPAAVDEATMTDLGRGFFHLFHLHNDARTLAWWIAHRRQAMLMQLREAIAAAAVTA